MSNFETKFKQTNSPDIGKVIDVSFSTFKKTVWISGVGILFLLLIIAPITFYTIFAYMGVSNLEDFVQKSQTIEHDFNYLMLNAAIGIVLAIIITPLTAGFYKINHLANHNKEFGLSNLFDYYKSPYFVQLVVSGVLINLYSNIVGLLLIYLNLPFIGNLMQAFVGLLFIYASPLIIFENQTALSAMSNSAKIATKYPFTTIICLVFAFIIAMLGIFALCIGIFFSIGYIYTMNYSLYNEIIPIEKNNPIDEIGQD